ALGLAVGVALGLWRRGAPTLISPHDSPWNRLPLAALRAPLVGLITRVPPALLASPAPQRRTSRPGAIAPGWLLRAAAVAAIAWWVVPVTNPGEEAGPEELAAAERMTWLLPACAGVMFAQWALLEPLAARPAGGSIPFLLALCAFTAAAVLI